MKSKIYSILLLVPILLSLIIFTSSKTVQLPIDILVDEIKIEHDETEYLKVGETLTLKAKAYPNDAINKKIIWSIAEGEEQVTLSENVLTAKKEGTAKIKASTLEGTVSTSFIVSIYENSIITIVDESKSNMNIDPNHFYYGQYDLSYTEDGKIALAENGISLLKNPAKQNLKVGVLPSHLNQNVDYTIIPQEAATYDSTTQTITFLESGMVTITFTSNDVAKPASYTFEVVEKGINVYNYDELLACTNESRLGEVIVLRKSLESLENAYETDETGQKKLKKNTDIFGYRKASQKIDIDVDLIPSDYDTTYLKQCEGDDIPCKDERQTSVYAAVRFKKDVYGNGFTINLHELCYPTGKTTIQPEQGEPYDKPSLEKDDVYRGPLKFVQMSTFYVSGQDNIGFSVEGKQAVINDIKLRNCNAVKDLTFLDYVGTTLEILRDNVTIKNSVISNGRIVLRSFSNENLTIDNCLIQYGREFLMKVGSNKNVIPTPNQQLANNSSDYEILSPSTNNGEPLKSDSTVFINDTHFYKSGFFSIGMDTHFAGSLLYNGSDLIPGNVKGLAATSYPSEVTISGDTLFYDWKTLDSLDASTLIASVGTGDVNEKINIAQIIKDTIFQLNLENKLYESGQNIHGGIAFFGGGRNLSKVIFESQENQFYHLENVNLDIVPTYGTLLTQAAGYGPFHFYLYQSHQDNNLFNELPKIENLTNHLK